MKIVTPGITIIPTNELDHRSEAELITYLKNPPPVCHERNVWAFWDSGFANMRPWCQRNVLGWIRRQGPSWDVRVLDMVPDSATHVWKFVPKDYLPDCFNNGTMTGRTKGQHASDMARLPLLYMHGGVWLDVGSILFRNVDDIFWRALEDPTSRYEMAITLLQSRKYIGQCLTGFIGARKGNPFIERWMRVWLELWSNGRTEATGLREHPLLKPLGLIVPHEELEVDNPRQMDMGGVGKFDMQIVTDYLALNMAYERVRLLKDDSEGWNGPEYFRKHVHLLDTIDEVWKSHEMFLQDQLFPLLSLPFKPDDVEKDSQQKAARDYVGYVLANSSMAKFSQGFWQPGARVPLAMSWSKPENADADWKHGTWAGYLRWASISCKQERFKDQCLKSLTLPAERDEILVARLLG